MNAIDFATEVLRNENGNEYGIKYIIHCPESEFLDKQAALISTVIGEEYYYGPRSVWEQIHIVRASV